MTSEIKFEDFLGAQLRDLEDFMPVAREFEIRSSGNIPSVEKSYEAVLKIVFTKGKSRLQPPTETHLTQEKIADVSARGAELGFLEGARIFSVRLTDENKFLRFTEECDSNYHAELNKKGVGDLIRELINIYGAMKS